MESVKLTARLTKFYDKLVSDLFGEYKFSEKYLLLHKNEFRIKSTAPNTERNCSLFYYKDIPLFSITTELILKGGKEQYVLEVKKFNKNSDSKTIEDDAEKEVYYID